jgi:glutamyl-tRNA reductase
MVAFGEAFRYGTAWKQARTSLPAPAASFEGRTILIIGATGTICSEAAKLFASLHVSRLVFGVRNVEKGETLADEISEQHEMPRERISVWQLDMSSFASVKDFVRRVDEGLDRLDCVVMGQGTRFKKTQVTSDGWEQSTHALRYCSVPFYFLKIAEPSLQLCRSCSCPPRS